MSSAELIPMIRRLQHADKLRLMAFLVGELAREEGVNLSAGQQVGEGHTDALAELAGSAKPLGPANLARDFTSLK